MNIIQELIPLNLPNQNESQDLSLSKKKEFNVKTFYQRFTIPRCAFISDKEEDQVFFSCSCTADESALVCNECVKICHNGPGHFTSKFHDFEGNPICACGDNKHEMEKRPNYLEAMEQNENCFFQKLIRTNIPRFKIKSTGENYKCYFCQKFNEQPDDPEINSSLVSVISWLDSAKFQCHTQQKTGRIQLTIKFLQQFAGLVERGKKKSNEEINFLRKYIMDINYNSLKVLGIDRIFQKDIIQNDIRKFFLENVNAKGELELLSPIIFSNSFFLYVINAFTASQLLPNSRYVIPFNFFCSENEDKYKMSNDKLKLIMCVSKDLILFDDDKEDLFPQLIENMANGFFIFYNTFYHYVNSFYLKYKMMFRTTTIANLTILQRYYFLIKSKENVKELGTKEEVRDFEYWLEVIPNGLIDFMERIQSFKIHSADQFIPGLNSSTFIFFKVFKFLVKFNLIDELALLKFFKIVLQIFEHNLNKIGDSHNEGEFIMIPSFDIILEIVFLTLLYHNDKICIASLLKEETNKKLFVYTNDNNNDILYACTNIFIVILKFINYLKANENQQNPIKFIFQQKFHDNLLKKNYDSHKINYIIKQIFELYIESSSRHSTNSKKGPKCKLFIKSFR